MFFLCYYYNGDGMDIKIEDIQETNKVFNWKKLLIIILSILLFFVLIIVLSSFFKSLILWNITDYLLAFLAIINTYAMLKLD